MAMHSRSIDAQPEIISYVADSHVHCEHASTDLGLGSREFSTKYRKSEARLRRTGAGNADQRESCGGAMKAMKSYKSVFRSANRRAQQTGKSADSTGLG